MVKNHLASASRRAWPQAILFVAFCLVVLSAGVGVRAQELAALPAPWIVAEAIAPVEVRHDRGPWQPLAAGAAVAAASEIRTGRDGRVLLVRGEDRVQLFAQSYLELPPAKAGSSARQSSAAANAGPPPPGRANHRCAEAS